MIKKFNKEQIGEVLQQIYDAEINIGIDWFWNEGIDWKIGDKVNGFKTVNEIGISDVDNIGTDIQDWTKIENSISALAFAVYKAYPDSKFAEWYIATARQEGLHPVETEELPS